MNDDEILDTPAAAQFLKVPVRTLEAWRYRRSGPPFIRLNRANVRYRLSDLLAFLERSTVTPADSGRTAA